MTDITSAMTHEFSRAKLWRLLMLLLQGLVAAGSLMAVGQSDDWVSYYGLSTLILVSISLWMRKNSELHYQCAERYRRLLFDSKSYGEEIPAHVIGVILADYKDADQHSTLPEDQYYDSGENPGYRRMLENLQESSFYTRKLASTSHQVTRGIVVLGLAVAFVYLLISVIRGSHPEATALRHSAEITTKLLAFAALGSYFDLWLGFSNLARTSDQIFTESSVLLERKEVIEREALKLVTTYDCVLAASSPIPTLIWRYHQTALQKGWHAVKTSRSAQVE